MNVSTARTRSAFIVALLAFAMLAVTSSAPACVGTRTSASCTEVALNACLPGGGKFDGTVTFNCGGTATITVTPTGRSCCTSTRPRFRRDACSAGSSTSLPGGSLTSRRCEDW